MTITTAEYKAALEAKIAAASGATAIKDLATLKSNADLWLANNAGAITGYASLEALIQAKQNALTGSSPANDLSFIAASAFPPTAGVGGGTVYSPDEFTLNPVASGLSGVLLTVTPDTDECVCLHILAASSATQTSIEVKFGSRIVVPSTSLGHTTVASAISLFSIGPSFPSSIADEIIGRPGEPLVITKTTGSTSQNINIVYSIGKLL